MSNYLYDSRVNELIEKKSACDITLIGNHDGNNIQGYLVNKINSIYKSTIILPDLSSYLILTQYKNGDNKVFFVGPRTKSILINRSPRLKTVLFQIKPNGLFLNKTIHIKDTVNQTIELKDIFAQETSDLLMYKYLYNSDASNELLKADILPFKFNPIDGFYEQVLFYLKNESNFTVSNLAFHLGISQRYLQKLSNEHFGISPKKVLKTARIHKSLSFVANDTTLNHAQIAILSGYFDQSHMIDEYQTLIGKTPKQLFY